MTNKILRKEFNSKYYEFNDLINDFDCFSYREHRRGSTFFTKAIIELNHVYFPELDKDLYGFWETNQFIDSEDDRNLFEIYELNRVELSEKIIVEKYWKIVSNE